MKLQIRDPYWYSWDTIKKIEEYYQAKYLGFWSIKDKFNNWSNVPVEVFYQSNPKTELGHSNYFGIYTSNDDKIMICNAISAFSQDIIGIVEDDVVYISKYNHDYISTPGGKSIDGGRNGLWLNNCINVKLVKVLVDKDDFLFELMEK